MTIIYYLYKVDVAVAKVKFLWDTNRENVTFLIELITEYPVLYNTDVGLHSNPPLDGLWLMIVPQCRCSNILLHLRNIKPCLGR